MAKVTRQYVFCVCPCTNATFSPHRFRKCLCAVSCCRQRNDTRHVQELAGVRRSVGRARAALLPRMPRWAHCLSVSACGSCHNVVGAVDTRCTPRERERHTFEWMINAPQPGLAGVLFSKRNRVFKILVAKSLRLVPYAAAKVAEFKALYFSSVSSAK